MEEIIDPIDFDPDYNRGETLGKKWKNCQFMTIEALQNHTGFGYFVWPNEGVFDQKKNFQFFKTHEDYEPLLVDRNSASLLMQLSKISDSAFGIMNTKMLENRVFFLKLAKLAWKYAAF